MSTKTKQTLNEKIKDVAKRIRTAREAVGITIEQAAAELNITPAEYTKYEEGTIIIYFQIALLLMECH